MNEPNPYTPPSAFVSDIQLNEDVPRPRLLDVAAMLLWADLGLWVITTFCDVSAGKLLKGQSPPTVVILLVFSTGVNAWLVAKVAAGRNWARIVWLILSGGGMIGQFVAGFPAGWFDQSSWILQTIMSVVVFVILLTPTAGRWFNRRALE